MRKRAQSLFGYDTEDGLVNPIAAGFDRFWALYPKKVGKLPAWQLWERMQPSATLTETILAAVARQARSKAWLKDDGEFVPHAKTWLFQQRWTDELPTPAGTAVQTWVCPHTPHCPHRTACAIVTARTE